ncbi:hypothetical protein EJ110_NYTH59529 [Nymphaea thermarum]|nr:hypothetical protein EJ110_NYTH59529 [Nymphaea thermarum]
MTALGHIRGLSWHCCSFGTVHPHCSSALFTDLRPTLHRSSLLTVHWSPDATVHPALFITVHARRSCLQPHPTPLFTAALLTPDACSSVWLRLHLLPTSVSLCDVSASARRLYLSVRLCLYLRPTPNLCDVSLPLSGAPISLSLLDPAPPDVFSVGPVRIFRSSCLSSCKQEIEKKRWRIVRWRQKVQTTMSRFVISKNSDLITLQQIVHKRVKNHNRSPTALIYHYRPLHFTINTALPDGLFLPDCCRQPLFCSGDPLCCSGDLLFCSGDPLFCSGDLLRRSDSGDLENYFSWSPAMTMGIVARDRMTYIDGSNPEPARTSGVWRTWFLEVNQVKTWIVNSVSPEIQPLILRKKTARDMWVVLEQMYGQKKTDIRMYQVMKTVYNLRQGSSSVAEYYGALKAKWEELDYHSDLPWHCPQDQALHVAQEWKNRVFLFLAGLNDEFEGVRSQILNSGEVSKH